MIDDLDARIRHLAAARGFAEVYAAPIGPTPEFTRYEAWLSAGRAADMRYLSETLEVRRDPRNRLAGARSALVLVTHYSGDFPPDPGGCTGMIARYAVGRDYHNSIGKRIKRLAADLRAEGIAAWGGTDTAPILERAWSAASGAGFAGKNACQIQPGRGSYFFLSVIFVGADLRPTAPSPGRCGTCTRCLDTCPTGALVGPGEVDAARCLAYWSIEARGLPPVEIRRVWGRHLFGCDDCQAICPHNRHPSPPDSADFEPREAWLDLPELLATPDEALRARFIGSPLGRAGPTGLKRNALLALPFTPAPSRGIRPARAALGHPDEVVRAAAVWALRRLGMEVSLPQESTPIVIAELRRPPQELSS